MKSATFFCFFMVFAPDCESQTTLQRKIDEYQKKVDDWLVQVDHDLLQFNAISAKLSWDVTTGKITENTQARGTAIILARNAWKNKVCDFKIQRRWLSAEQKRKMYLLCRGPKFTEETARKELNILNEMRGCYQLEVCFDLEEPTPLDLLARIGQNITNYPNPGDCLLGEPDLEGLMRRTDLNSDQLKWVWTTWHNTVAKAMRNVYPKVVKSQNQVARSNGYKDMGEVWRDELEIPELQQVVEQLYKQVEPIYKALHAAVRHKLLLKYGPDVIEDGGSIPIHLLGNMWGQNWASLIELFDDKNFNLNDRLKKKNWTVHDMVLRSEDFYTSMGLPPMTDKFWKYSIFEHGNNISMCHGTAANLFAKDDYRMLLCAKLNMEDFYVIHHEMGHIEYNMAYKNQPAIFQEGTNSAFHETIGDVIMHGVMSPQHLYRLGLLEDSDLTDPKIERHLLLEQALAKVAETPFSLIVDKYRWGIFDGSINEDEYNEIYWEMNKKIRGIVPPEHRGEMFMDAGAKFHVPDNTPYIRYFLSSILQMQVFKGLCELSLFGRHRNKGEDDTLSIPLHKCDIYGCKKCGRKLREAMSWGASEHWSTVLEHLTGSKELSTRPFLEFYSPIYKWLRDYINTYNIVVGW